MNLATIVQAVESHIKFIVHEIHSYQESRRSEVARYFKGSCKHVIVIIFFFGGGGGVCS